VLSKAEPPDPSSCYAAALFANDIQTLNDLLVVSSGEHAAAGLVINVR
jgi:hypothetical protein